MPDKSPFRAVELLPNGRRIEIRALRPDDKAELLAAVGRTSAQSLYRRFFGVKRDFTEKEIEFFLSVDFTSHVALIAVVLEGGREVIVGGGRYVVLQPGTAELAFMVEDGYQGQGIATVLMRHLVAFAQRVSLKELVADVLPDNSAMLKVFEKSGLGFETRREKGIVHVSLRL